MSPRLGGLRLPTLPTRAEGDSPVVALVLSPCSAQGCPHRSSRCDCTSRAGGPNQCAGKHCAKQCLELFLGLVLYQRRLNKYDGGGCIHEEDSFPLRRQNSVGLLGKEKCGKWHKHPSTLRRRRGGRDMPGDGEAHPYLMLLAPAPLGIMQLLWPALKEKPGPYL